ncbi:MAG: DUF3089 domain-containing protein [Acidimicrobiales bacterium]
MAEDVGGPWNGVRTARWRAAALLVVGSLLASAGTAVASSAPAGAQGAATSATATVWLCQPGAADDPCASSLTTTVVQASGAIKEVSTQDDNSSPFDCFYVYPTVSKQKTTNADLKVQRPEIDAAVYEASRFSTVCKVWAPMYRQVTLAGLAAHLDLDLPPSATDTAFDSLQSAFEDYLAHDNDGRPIVFIGHSQGAAMLILLLKRLVDDNPTLRNRTVLAIILGGNVEVKTGSEVGGSFSHIPVCDSNGEAGCVIAYSTFPGTPPMGSLFGRPGRGVSLQSGQTARTGLQVACVNPAAVGGGTAPLDSYFPPTSGVSTPWVEYPDLYTARCEHGDGATWLEVKKAEGGTDHRPVVSEVNGPDWGYHPFDVNLGLGNLVTDVAAAEATWSRGSNSG